jgi:hypothetical protein
MLTQRFFECFSGYDWKVLSAIPYSKRAVARLNNRGVEDLSGEHCFAKIFGF